MQTQASQIEAPQTQAVGRSSRSIRNINRAAQTAAGLLLVLVLGFSWQAWRESKAHIETELSALAALGERSVDTMFAELETGLGQVGLKIVGDSHPVDSANGQRLMAAFLAAHTEVQDSALVRADGQVLSSGTLAADAPLPSLAHDPSFQAALKVFEHGMPVSVGRAFSISSEAGWVVPLWLALRDKRGHLTHCLKADLPVEFLQTVWYDAPVALHAAIGLTRDDGYVMSQYPLPADVAPETFYSRTRAPFLAHGMGQGPSMLSGLIESTSSVDGRSYLVGYRHLRRYPVTFYVQIPRSELWSGWWEMVRIPYLLLALISGAGFAIYRGTVRRQRAWEGDQRLAQDAEHESRRQLQAIIDAMPQSVYLRDMDGRFRLVNSSAAERLQVPAADLIGRTTDQLPLGNPQSIQLLAEYDRKLLETGQSVELPELHTVLPGQNERWVRIVKVPLRNAAGELSGILTVADNITERKLGEAHVRDSERLLQTVFDALPHLVIVKDREGRYLMVNRAWTAMHGLDSAQAIHKLPSEVPSMVAQDGAMIARQDQAILSGEVAVLDSDTEIGIQSGERLRFLTLRRPLRDADGAINGLVVVGVDVTAQQQAEEKLRASERLLQTVFDTIPHLVSVKDREGRYLMVNRTWSQLYGVGLADALHKTAYDVPTITRKDADYIAEKDNQILSGSKAALELESRIGIKGGELHYFRSLRRPLHDSTGAITGMVMVAVDETAQKLAEEKLRASEQALQQAQKMEALGQLTSGVAHEFNNVLQIVSGYVELALLDHDLKGSTREELQGIETGVSRAAALTRQLLTYVRADGFQPEPVDLAHLVDSASRLLGTLLGPKVDLNVTALEGVGRVAADRSMLDQILVNLAVNARDAMPDGGRIEIEAGHAEFDESYCIRNPWAEPGSYGSLRFTDTGAGMTDRVLKRIFDPFFTTKEPGKGTGLGLSVVYGIVKQHGGLIRVDSRLGAGTTFRIYLPAA
jgi:PAS domain S-box-containing protein